jgi:hypothetical protein
MIFEESGVLSGVGGARSHVINKWGEIFDSRVVVTFAVLRGGSQSHDSSITHSTSID